jgi:hypothetical protein
MKPATPWDALLHAGPVQMTPRADDPALESQPGTKLAALLHELAACGSASTLTLAVRADLTPRQVWGLLKTPRNIGQVRFEAGRWTLMPDFQGREVERAAALLRACGWRVQRPNERRTGDQRP